LLFLTETEGKALNEQGLRREPTGVQDVETGAEYSIAQNLGKDVV
jgi:hypothetical protein